jgi:hypothetical protein
MPLRALLHKFISLLRIELEELEQDIRDLLELWQRRKDSHEITNYVYLENKGLLLNEVSCVKELLDSIASVDTSRYDSVDQMIFDVDAMIAKRIRDCAFPEVLHSLVKRRLEKIRQYMGSPLT